MISLLENPFRSIAPDVRTVRIAKDSELHNFSMRAPSPEDISSTMQLQRILSALGILVLDHIIVAGDRTYSMIQHGDIDYRIKGR